MAGNWEDDDWGRPVEGTGEFARVKQLEGHLLIVFPIGYIDHSPTRFTVPGKKSDAIVCDVVDLDDTDETGAPGKVFRTSWWRSAQLIVGLRPFIGSKVLGRIAQGIPRNGMNAPWEIRDSVSEPGAVDRARAWKQAHPDFILSTFTQPPVVTTPQPPPPQQPNYPNQGYQQPQQPQQRPANDWQQAPAAGYGGPPPNYQQPAAQPQYQGPTAPTQQGYPQQGPPANGYQQQPQNYGGPAPQAPSYPVPGAPPQDPGMLELMRAERARREAANQQQWHQEEPPF